MSIDAARDPQPWLSAARASSPVFYLEEQAAWYVTRYADILTVLRDPETFSSRYANKFRPITSPVLQQVYPDGHPGRHSMLLKDPPEHSRIRRLANKAFSPKMAATMEPRIRARCHALIDDFVADRHCELISRYSSHLAVHTMMDITGAPMTLGEEFARWGHDYFMLTTGAPPIGPEEELQLAARARRMTAWLRQYVQQCQDNPGDDLISALLCATTEEGDPALTYDEVVGVLNSTMVAGVETTAVFIPALVGELLKEPHRWKLLRDDPSLRAQAIEEGLRYLCPARGVRRTTTRDVELGGETLPAGVDVFVGYVSANFDEAVFDDAGHFDLHRPNADRHLSFGKGPHFCIGAAVARLEARVALDALLERIPELRLADDHVDEWIPHMTLPRRTAVQVAW